MNYHNITTDDMLNGCGLRTVLWVAGCNHFCKNCQNPITWNQEDGLLFDEKAKTELFEKLNKPHIDGITFSGGDPLFPKHRQEVLNLASEIAEKFPEKTIWLYTGYTWEEIMNEPNLKFIDVIAEGEFVEELKDNNIHWVGSSNQRVIKVKETLKSGKIVLLEEVQNV